MSPHPVPDQPPRLPGAPARRRSVHDARPVRRGADAHAAHRRGAVLPRQAAARHRQRPAHHQRRDHARRRRDHAPDRPDPRRQAATRSATRSSRSGSATATASTCTPPTAAEARQAGHATSRASAGSLTGSTGEYYFRTIKPVPYPGRTPHIHFKVKKGGKELLTTQCYVKGHPGNDRDGVRRHPRPEGAESVTVEFAPIKESQIGELAAKFDMVLGVTPENTARGRPRQQSPSSPRPGWPPRSGPAGSGRWMSWRRSSTASPGTTAGSGPSRTSTRPGPSARRRPPTGRSRPAPARPAARPPDDRQGRVPRRRLRSSFGLPHLRFYRPAADCEAVARLRRAGAVILGRTAVPFACFDWQCRPPLARECVNPLDPARTPGGSSGGAAAALAARFTPLELGTDVAGSIRYPAHCCGVFGLRTTVGLVPAADIGPPPGKPLFPSVISVGPMARSVEDLGLLLYALLPDRDAREVTPRGRRPPAGRRHAGGRGGPPDAASAAAVRGFAGRLRGRRPRGRGPRPAAVRLRGGVRRLGAGGRVRDEAAVPGRCCGAGWPCGRSPRGS